MYSPAFQLLLVDTRIEDLRRARGTSIRPYPSREDRTRRAPARSALLSRLGMRRVALADAFRTASGPRS